jgi:glutamate-5-semialdehyde dehydrogenase
MEQLEKLTPGLPVAWGGNHVTRVSEELAAAFQPGDSLIVMQTDGSLLHIPAGEQQVASAAVDAATAAFDQMGGVSDEKTSEFYELFASTLADDSSFAPIAAANRSDVARAKARGRSATRLVLSDRMRADMIDGLRSWSDAPAGRGSVIESIEHEGWRVDQVRDGLGVVGFVFEGRPNVFADAAGVLRSGNTVVFRIGSDALGTARAIVEHALRPALSLTGLPPGAAVLVDSAAHASAWAMFSDPRLALAVARGSGAATEQLGAVARQAGNSVSLHGTGGAWIVAGAQADTEAFGAAVYHSLDRKVCNTLNTCCIVGERADDLVPVFLDALERAGDRRGVEPKLHVLESSIDAVPKAWFARRVQIARADGEHEERQAELIAESGLGTEWEWEESPEVTLAIVPSVDSAIDWFNRYSPRFIASLISDDAGEQDRFFELVDAPFVGNGFTRWVDGQYALHKPELGLSNWEHGRLFGRGGILSGDSVYTVRSRVTQDNPDIGR